MNGARRFFSGVMLLAAICAVEFLVGSPTAFAQTTATNVPASSPAVPDMGGSMIRVFGALIFVVGLFLGGVWLVRNWQRMAVRKGISPKLNILEVRSLGQRQSIYVVGYQQQRMLIGASPAGITLLSHLPPAEDGESAPPATVKMSFADALQHVLNRKPK